MPATGYLAVFLIGLLGGVHCVGMCGGIVSALSVQLPNKSRQAFPIHLAYNLGRIGSYTLVGTLLGALGSMGFLLNNLLPLQLALYVLANLMLIALGLYLIGITSSLAFTEQVGHRLWRRIQPYSKRFIPARSWRQALPLGIVWGFLPCGMVYSVLATALVTGSAWRGGALMLAFGLGTLPNLLLAGMALKHLRDFTRHRIVRMAAGCIVIAFGIWGLIFTPELGGRLWNGVVCHI